MDDDDVVVVLEGYGTYVRLDNKSWQGPTGTIHGPHSTIAWLCEQELEKIRKAQKSLESKLYFGQDGMTNPE